MSVGNPESPEVKGVPVDHPSIVTAIENMARRGYSRERAVELIGMPKEVIDRVYKAVENEKK